MGFDKWKKELHYDNEQLKRICSSKVISDKNIIDVDTENKKCVIKGNRGTYNVSLEHCDCLDFNTRKLPCKHIYWLANNLGELETLPGLEVAIGEYRLQTEGSEQISLFSEEQKEIKEALKKEELTLDTLNKGDAAFGCCDKYKQCSIEGKCLQSEEISNYCSYKNKLEKGEIFYSKKSPRFSQEKYDYIDSWYKALSKEEQEAFGEIVSIFTRQQRGARHIICGNKNNYYTNDGITNVEKFKTAYGCIKDCSIFDIDDYEQLIRNLLKNNILVPRTTCKDFCIKNSINPPKLNDEPKEWENFLISCKDAIEILHNYFISISISFNDLFTLDEWASDNWKILPLGFKDFEYMIYEKNSRDGEKLFDLKKMKCLGYTKQKHHRTRILNIKIDDLIKQTGISKHIIEKLECGNSDGISESDIIKYSEFLKISLNDIQKDL